MRETASPHSYTYGPGVRDSSPRAARDDRGGWHRSRTATFCRAEHSEAPLVRGSIAGPAGWRLFYPHRRLYGKAAEALPLRRACPEVPKGSGSGRQILPPLLVCRAEHSEAPLVRGSIAGPAGWRLFYPHRRLNGKAAEALPLRRSCPEVPKGSGSGRQMLSPLLVCRAERSEAPLRRGSIAGLAGWKVDCPYVSRGDKIERNQMVF
jgi:hypothetical protein